MHTRSHAATRAAVVLLLILGLGEDLIRLARPHAALVDYYRDDLVENPRFLDQLGALAWGPVLLGSAVELAVSLLGVVILVRAWRRPEARALALFLALGGSGLPEGIGISGAAVQRFEVAAMLMGTAALLHFSMVFPEPIDGDTPGWPPPRLRRLLRPRSLALLAVAALAVVLLSGTAVGGALALTGFVAGSVVAALNMRASYRRCAPSERRRVLWVLNGFYALTWMLVIALPAMIAIQVTAAILASPRAAALGDVGFQTFAEGGLLLLPIFLGIGIFYDGAIDPRLAIRKTTVYGSMSVLTLALFMAVEGTASLKVMTLLPSDVGPWVAGGSVAIAFGPMRRWVERRTTLLVDRFIPVTALAEGAREEAAVVFADICGFTRTAALDEPAALTLASLLHASARRLAEQRGGRLVKTLGDGVVLEFPEAEPAVTTAVELRARFQAAAVAMGLERPELRSGVHQGGVAHGRDGDVFGAVVNLASRLQGAADPGEVLVSAAVAEALAAVPRWRVVPAGERTLKNVPEPVATYRVEAEAAAGAAG